jgi:hypothetical protein
MIFCFNEDRSFFNYILEKDNIKYTVALSPTDSVVLLHTPYPWTFSWANRVDEILGQNPSRVIVFVTELHQPIADWINQHPDLEYYIAGTVDGITHHNYMDWFAITRDFYKNRTHLLQDLHSRPVPEQYKVNALLGRKKQHRDLIYNSLLCNKQVTMTYMQTQHGIADSVSDPAQFIWEGTPQSVNWTIDQIEYDGEQVSLSQVIPTDVYRTTDWCVVAETNYQDGYVFFTEKTAKPIIAKRPFLIVGNPNSLRLLRRVGFQTFDSVIDESYDTDRVLESRVKKVADQVNYLTSLDAWRVRTMHHRINEIVEHNYQVMMSTDWQQTQLQELSEMIR